MALLVLGCGEPAREPLAPLPEVCDGTPARAVDFRTEVQPVIESKCASCHRTGGAGPFPLETPEQMKTMASSMRWAVCRRSMPPWQAHRDCNTYVDDLSLSDEQILLTRDEAKAGMPRVYSNFDKIDTGKLGYVTLDQVKAAMAAGTR